MERLFAEIGNDNMTCLISVSVPIAKQFLTINEKWVLVKFMKALGTGGVWGGPMVKMCSSETVPKAKQYQAVSSEIVPKAKQSMGYMDLPSNPF